MTIRPTLVQPHPAGSGTQKIYRFDNGYGASVVQFSFGPIGGSYGANEGRWELAVLRFDDVEGVQLNPANWDLTYDTPITDNVIGHLDEDEVEEILGRIRDLPDPEVVRVDSQLGEQPAIEGGSEAVR